MSFLNQLDAKKFKKDLSYWMTWKLSPRGTFTSKEGGKARLEGLHGLTIAAAQT